MQAQVHEDSGKAQQPPVTWSALDSCQGQDLRLPFIGMALKDQPQASPPMSRDRPFPALA